MDEKEKLLDAALPHVPFDGWSDACLAAAARECGFDGAKLKGLCPRGAVDLAAAYHRRGDRQMLEAFAGEGAEGLRYSERVARLVWLRLAASDKDIVRRGMALFALPVHAAEGASLVWGSADAIWRALGDTSDDINWYSKRAILSGVISSSVLYWLGDASPDSQATRDFIDRRIADVMRFERFKARVRTSPSLKPLAGWLDDLGRRVRAPKPDRRQNYPGWTRGGGA